MPLCAPLRYTTSQNAGSQELGSLEFSGEFAIANSGAVSVASGGLASVFQLERCGSPLAVLLSSPAGSPPLISSRAVAYLAATKKSHSSNYVAGFYLKGLRPFTASLPSAAVAAVGLGISHVLAGLTNQTIYVSGDGGTIWAASLPQPPTAPRC